MDIDTLLNGTLIETQQMIDERNHKLCLIEDIYKLEKALDMKKQTSFFLLYDLTEETLINMVASLTSMYKKNQEPKVIGRYF